MFVDYRLENSVASIDLNRPERLNAMGVQLVDELGQSLERAISEDAAVIVLAGKGRAFCAGYDLQEDESGMTLPQRRRALERVQDLTRLAHAAPAPVIAAVHGYALGGGFELVLACDFVIASEDAVFGFPEVGVGLGVTGGVSQFLPMAVGLMKAKELVFLGERFSAQDALALGLISSVVAAGNAPTEAARLAARLAQLPRSALAMAKFSLNRGSQTGLEMALALEVAQSMLLHVGADAIAASRQFRDRSKRTGG
jgi:2-(1,2-epoxy-1,2-dihydrophenyl)acetyl-CoA isomerase